jgi:hypothetical protein
MNGLESKFSKWLVAGFILLSSFSVRAAQTDSYGSKLTVEVLTNLTRGISLVDLAAKTGIAPQHQFAAKLGTNDFLCVKLSFESPRGYFYFLFRDGSLTAVLNRPWRVEFETNTYRGKPWQIPKARDPEAQLMKTVQGLDLSPGEIFEKFQEWSKNEIVAAKGKEPGNILPAFIITERLSKPKRIAAEREAASLAEQFDAFKIKLGASTNELKLVLGDPVRTINNGSNCLVQIYGAKLPPNVPAVTPSVWISVLLCDGKVIRIFSHDFFDKRLVNGIH